MQEILGDWTFDVDQGRRSPTSVLGNGWRRILTRDEKLGRKMGPRIVSLDEIVSPPFTLSVVVFDCAFIPRIHNVTECVYILMICGDVHFIFFQNSALTFF